MLCSLFGWAVFGLFVGAIARLIWPHRQPIGLIRTMPAGRGRFGRGRLGDDGPARRRSLSAGRLHHVDHRRHLVLWVYQATTRPRDDF